MERDLLKCICDIIKTYMNLTDEQIWLFNSNYLIPNTSGIFVVVQDIGSKTYGLTFKESVNDDNELQEEISKMTQKIVQIDMYSKTKEAYERQDEIIMAINSNISEQTQEKYQFKIANIELSTVNTSYQEGGYMLNRFTWTLNALYGKSISKSIDYFDKFEKEIIIK